MPSDKMTLIKDLKPSREEVNVIFHVISQISRRQINKGQNAPQEVATYKVADATGTINLTAWNETIQEITIGSTYELSKAHINVFNDHLQLAVGRNGVIKASNAKFETLNEENNISDKKVKPRERRPAKRTANRGRNKFTRSEDNFSTEVNKKYMWAEYR
ncbi:MAG: hypothetical protein ACTSW1_09920 [Candidatus Hodarchaeales archaeon]